MNPVRLHGSLSGSREYQVVVRLSAKQPLLRSLRLLAINQRYLRLHRHGRRQGSSHRRGVADTRSDSPCHLVCGRIPRCGAGSDSLPPQDVKAGFLVLVPSNRRRVAVGVAVDWFPGLSRHLFSELVRDAKNPKLFMSRPREVTGRVNPVGGATNPMRGHDLSIQIASTCYHCWQGGKLRG